MLLDEYKEAFIFRGGGGGGWWGLLGFFAVSIRMLMVSLCLLLKTSLINSYIALQRFD